MSDAAFTLGSQISSRARRRDTMRAMILYVCPSGSSFMHPCRDAAEALNKAGHTYETRQVKGGIGKPWT